LEKIAQFFGKVAKTAANKNIGKIQHLFEELI
jgi:hypothetical protein